ncbi:hypothetical protein [Planomonospora sp. ID82291]|uniref:hypothetical protein n=1 Tax=Planomonospora sp. ID82291 TaxID=2738136 RepID=UPI0018C3549A|nr:hypothetical protein [Planomonospora sp. ID82291]MBG0818921.1 hypothetical protein [Planomonospora sp. ID82291]
MTINLAAAVVAGVTSIVVTLLVEYAAKPRLEARKERILDAVRARRKLTATLLDIGLAAAVLREDLPAIADPVVQQKVRAERARQYKRLEELGQELVDGSGRYLVTLLGLPRRLTANAAFAVLGVLMSARTRRDQAEAITGLVTPLATVLETPLWRLLKRGRAALELTRQLAAIQEPSSEERAGGAQNGVEAPPTKLSQ